jgi:CubicO group peptidase (beta-lactamase class C family)
VRGRALRAGALALALPSAALAAPPAPSPPAPARIASAAEAIRAEMAQRAIPGLSAAIALDRQLRWAEGFGVADLENGVAARAETVYRLGSVSKPITATAVLQLWERGALDLDGPVQKHCPSFPEKPWPVTARQLLAHLGGVRHYARGEFESTRHYLGLNEALTIFKDDPLVHEPGTRYLYSTYGYNLLGCAVEGASGSAFVEYVSENVFRPAGMEGARADDVFAIVPNRAQGYVRTAGGHRNSGLADTSYKVPGGGIAATATDVARLAIGLQTGVLLRPETLELMLTRQRTRDGKPTGVGLGLRLGERDGRREAWHTGAQQRVSTVLYMQPDHGLAVALLCNLEDVAPALLDLARRVADILGASLPRQEPAARAGVAA